MTGGETVDVFFYGLFMDQDLLVERSLRPAKLRRAVVEDYELQIRARATLVPAPGKRVWGIVMALPQSEVETLYAEPSVTAYGPESVTAKAEDGTSIDAICYNLATGDRGSANKAYAVELADLAARLLLPSDYVAELIDLAQP